VSFKIAAGNVCAVIAAESADGYGFHFTVKTTVGGFRRHNLAKEIASIQEW